MVLSSDSEIVRLLEAWWESLVLVGKLLLWYFRVLHHAMYGRHRKMKANLAVNR